MLTLQLPKEKEERLSFFAKEEGKDMNFLVKEAVLSFIEDLEDIHTAEKIIQRVRNGEEETIPLSEVKL